MSKKLVIYKKIRILILQNNRKINKIQMNFKKTFRLYNQKMKRKVSRKIKNN